MSGGLGGIDGSKGSSRADEGGADKRSLHCVYEFGVVLLWCSFCDLMVGFLERRRARKVVGGWVVHRCGGEKNDDVLTTSLSRCARGGDESVSQSYTGENVIILPYHLGSSCLNTVQTDTCTFTHFALLSFMHERGNHTGASPKVFLHLSFPFWCFCMKAKARYLLQYLVTQRVIYLYLSGRDTKLYYPH